MLIVLGYLVVLGTVFGGYMMTGGHLGALYQPAELVIIGGAGVGAFIVGNNGKAIKGTLKALPLLFRRSKYTKSMYMDLLGAALSPDGQVASTGDVLPGTRY
ncbi:Chemotaxis protein MotA [Leclercia adecarboxylata]|uniref:Chemotaxis protein MotA n=1 Tax=Leclercia adecarboxylata TaxID=83655 RepID=A0A4U9HYY4_9ENTR|nr:Chemotaxis protein MotA [Leclercia adecarboxylata]